MHLLLERGIGSEGTSEILRFHEKFGAICVRTGNNARLDYFLHRDRVFNLARYAGKQCPGSDARTAAAGSGANPSLHTDSSGEA